MSRCIFHIDVNSAYLSFEAAYRLQQDISSVDLRTIPSAVGGDIKKRRGIILAKSIPAKPYNIITGEPLMSALQKCPILTVVPPNYNLYLRCSRALMALLREYSPTVEQYSIDECFLDYTGLEPHWGSPLIIAEHLRTRIQKELGFTVNIGISSNKLLAKMASDFKKPNFTHTLYPDEIPRKLWPLPVGELFMVGRATGQKLTRLGILTIGDLAHTPVDFLYSHFKSYAYMLHHYANGQDSSVVKTTFLEAKGIGNSTTTSFDVTDRETAYLVILALTESVAMRLRATGKLCTLVAISIKSNQFESASHQRKFFTPTQGTSQIYRVATALFDELWEGQPLRHLGVRVSTLVPETVQQVDLFEYATHQKMMALDGALDTIRNRYGKDAVMRATFLHSGLKPIMGGAPEEDFPMMSSLL